MLLVQLQNILTPAFAAGIAVWASALTALAFYSKARTNEFWPSFRFVALSSVALFGALFIVFPIVVLVGRYNSRIDPEGLVQMTLLAGPGFLFVAAQAVLLEVLSAAKVRLSNKWTIFCYCVALLAISANCLWLYVLSDFDGSRHG